MNQILAGGIALILGLLLWGIGKKPKKTSQENLFQPQEETFTTLVRINNKIKPLSKNVGENPSFCRPKNEKERISLRKKLFKLISSSPEERLHAIEIAHQWGHSCVLPIIRRGLKDSDSRIVIAAAEGIQKYKKSSKIHDNQDVERLPRNVFLIR